ncbi:MAG: PEGA domain-containing protein, partial [Deltaproteobacteria bacterium]|nr:PEGA domain-containing protein [Deltaproteobacteria bacterium]
MSELRHEDVLELIDLDRGIGPACFTPEHGTRTAFVARTLELAALAQPTAPRFGSVVAADSKPLSTGARIGVVAAIAAALLLALGAVAFFWVQHGDDGERETPEQPVAQPQPPEEQMVPPEQLESPEPPTPLDPVVEERELPPEPEAVTEPKKIAGKSLKAGGKGTVAPPTVSKGTGRLNVNSKPWSQVFVDGKKVGSTPIAGLELKPGSHTVKLKVPLSGVVYSYKIAIKAGATTTLVKNLENEKPQIFGDPKKPSGPPGKLTVQTKPWSTVFINGRKIKNTPLVNYSLK